MAVDRKSSLLSSVVAPWFLLLGVVASFLACRTAGRVLSDVNCYGDLKRFEPTCNYLSQHYPTIGHVRALARARLDPDKVAVVAGGNSIHYGHGCSDADLWTERLQELLGADYRVINLGVHGGSPQDFGAPAAEVLLAEFPKLLFITNKYPGPRIGCGEPEGQPSLRYFFWEAHERGWLLNNPDRERWLHDRARQHARRPDGAFQELTAQVALDVALGFRDLWTAVEYRHFATTWCPVVGSTWWRPRKAYVGKEISQAPWPAATLDSMAEAELQRIHDLIEPHKAFLKERGSPAAAAANEWELTASVRACFPEPLRKRTLMLINHPNPYFLNQVAPAERADYFRLSAWTVTALERAGMTAAEVGGDYPVECFFDRVHLTKAGAARLAEDVAPRLREMAQRLGYVRTRPE